MLGVLEGHKTQAITGEKKIHIYIQCSISIGSEHLQAEGGVVIFGHTVTRPEQAVMAHNIEFLWLAPTFIFLQGVTAQLRFPYIAWHCRGMDDPTEVGSSHRCTATGYK